MDDVTRLITTFIDSVALIMALVFLVSLLKRRGESRLVNGTVMGVMFSFAVVVTMSDPILLPSDVIYDMRTLLIGAGVALLGPAVGLMALVTAIIYRVGIGGAALVPGLAAIVLSFSGGLIWRYLINDRPWRVWQKSVILGLLISLNGFAIFLLPQSAWPKLLIGLVPYIIISHIVGSLLLYYLIRGELSFHYNAETSRREASTDHLTGLLNRRGLDLVYPELENPINMGRGRALLYFDIDRFKCINDTYGHAVGDAVLKSVSRTVAGYLRPQDIFARLGGDEFVVVLNKIDAHEAERIAQRCCDVVALVGFSHEEAILPVSISVGGIWMMRHTDIDRSLDQADDALYAAKSGGRNKVVFRRKSDHSDAPLMAEAV